MTREPVHTTGFSSADPARVWAVVRDFGGAWHPMIEDINIERAGGGAQVRRFTVKGEDTVYRERLIYRSETDRCLAYTHLEGIAGAERYVARLTVAPAAAGGSVITWTAEISAPAERARDIASGTRTVFEAGLAALAGDLPPPAPDARPAPASGETEAIADLILEGTPRLALSVTPERPGPLCLFLHGIGGGRSNWNLQLPAVAPFARAAALDLRGYGDSTLGFTPSTVDLYCEDMLRVADTLNAERLILCGLSYGSWLATSFAMRHPDRLAGLVLSGGCTGMSEAGPEEREAFRVSREVPLDAGRVPADFAPAVVEVIAGPEADAPTRKLLHDSMAAIPAQTYRDALICFTNPLEKFDFSKLEMPVLLMTGAHDRLAPPAEIRSIAGRIVDSAPMPDVQFEVIADAGHVANVEAPEAYNTHLARFVQRVAACP